MAFLRSEKRYLPTLHFGEKVAHFTVRSRKAPAVLPSDFNHILLNKKIPAALKTDELTQAGSSGSEIRDEEERMSFRTFIETRVPSLSKPYKPCWWLPTGHVQTAYCVMANFDAVDTVVYKRLVYEPKRQRWSVSMVFIDMWFYPPEPCYAFRMAVQCKVIL